MEVQGTGLLDPEPKQRPTLLLSEDHQSPLHESYIVGSPILRGQYSTVYRCLYKGKVERACRIYNKKNVNKEKVKNDLKCIMSLNHPNITQIFDAFETEDELQVVCERLTGDELFERVVELGHYSEREAAAATSTVLTALKYLHSHNIVHGDVRPESLIFHSERSDAPLKLRDVSFSKLQPDTSAVIYLAPEYQEHTQTSKAEDIWSLGIVVYTMLCGLEPVDHKLDESNSLHLPFLEDMSPTARSFVTQALETDPERRMTASEGLYHPWVVGDSDSARHLHSTVCRLKELNARRRFRIATNAVLATKIIGEKITGIPVHRKEKDCP